MLKNPANSRNSILILEWGKQCLSFSVYYKKDNKIINSGKLPINYNLSSSTKEDYLNAMQDINVFGYNYESVYTLIDTSFITIMPNSNWQEDHIAETLHLNMQFTKDNMCYSKIAILEKQYDLMFASPKALVEASNSFFSNNNIYPSDLPLFQKDNSKYNKNTSSLNIHLFDEDVAILYVKGDETKFYNRFSYKTKEDVLYFTINVMQHLQLHNEYQKVLMSGNNAGQVKSFMQQYIKHLALLEVPNTINYNDTLVKKELFINHYRLVC